MRGKPAVAVDRDTAIGCMRMHGLPMLPCVRPSPRDRPCSAGSTLVRPAPPRLASASPRGRLAATTCCRALAWGEQRAARQQRPPDAARRRNICARNGAPRPCSPQQARMPGPVGPGWVGQCVTEGGRCTAAAVASPACRLQLCRHADVLNVLRLQCCVHAGWQGCNCIGPARVPAVLHACTSWRQAEAVLT